MRSSKTVLTRFPIQLSLSRDRPAITRRTVDLSICSGESGVAIPCKAMPASRLWTVWCQESWHLRMRRLDHRLVRSRHLRSMPSTPTSPRININLSSRSYHHLSSLSLLNTFLQPPELFHALPQSLSQATNQRVHFPQS